MPQASPPTELNNRGCGQYSHPSFAPSPLPHTHLAAKLGELTKTANQPACAGPPPLQRLPAGLPAGPSAHAAGGADGAARAAQRGPGAARHCGDGGAARALPRPGAHAPAGEWRARARGGLARRQAGVEQGRAAAAGRGTALALARTARAGERGSCGAVKAQQSGHVPYGAGPLARDPTPQQRRSRARGRARAGQLAAARVCRHCCWRRWGPAWR